MHPTGEVALDAIIGGCSGVYALFLFSHRGEIVEERMGKAVDSLDEQIEILDKIGDHAELAASAMKRSMLITIFVLLLLAVGTFSYVFAAISNIWIAVFLYHKLRIRVLNKELDDAVDRGNAVDLKQHQDEQQMS